jgi:hypothetical protein
MSTKVQKKNITFQMDLDIYFFSHKKNKKVVKHFAEGKAKVKITKI